MAEKLRSILKQTNWSLVLKAAIFGVAWFALPFWIFLLIALYLYFVPSAGSAKVAVPFFALLILSLFEGRSIFFAIILAGLFYLISLIKDLLIIDRRLAYEILILLLTYLLARAFFMKVGGDFTGPSLFYSILIAWAFGAMVSGYIKNFSPSPSPEAHTFLRAVGWITFLIMWQLLIAGLFLPLDFVYQSAIVFLLSMVFIDLIPSYVFGELSREKIFATSAVIFTALVIMLASARWVL